MQQVTGRSPEPRWGAESGRVKRLPVVVAVLLVVGTMWMLGRWADPSPFGSPPAGSFAFAVLGDAPYSPWEEIQYRRVLRQLNENDLTLVLHVGDIFGRLCRDDYYSSRLAYFQRLQHPVIYTPGDNEWADCHERSLGAYAPLERLAYLRSVFFSDPHQSLGHPPLALESQADGGRFAQFVENARWVHRGTVFATVHLVGSANGMEEFPGRTGANDIEAKLRTEAAAVWLLEAFAEAEEIQAQTLIVAFHGDPHFERPLLDPERQAYQPFLKVLEQEASHFGGAVLVAHGDGHQFRTDQPLVDEATGEVLKNVTRLEVPGSPDVGWVRVLVTPGSQSPFSFQELTVPRWLLW